MKLSLSPRSSGREPPHALQIYGCLPLQHAVRALRPRRQADHGRSLDVVRPTTDATFPERDNRE
jgi:hypothetical protein